MSKTNNKRKVKRHYVLNKVVYNEFHESDYDIIDTMYFSGRIEDGINRILSVNDLMPDYMELIHENSVFSQAWLNVEKTDYCIEVDKIE